MALAEEDEADAAGAAREAAAEILAALNDAEPTPPTAAGDRLASGALDFDAAPAPRWATETAAD